MLGFLRWFQGLFIVLAACALFVSILLAVDNAKTAGVPGSLVFTGIGILSVLISLAIGTALPRPSDRELR
ncbi:hypothetical protein [Salininema proteolyticum]|uniref:Uncharacterized protein n=1 Tax=Salininema proteolyticum TaxID=1607685 RepID=A0ABV8TT86_9ACTN